MNSLLWEFGQQLPTDSKFQAVLKLAYLRKSLQHEEIDASEYNKMCRKCFIPWTAGYFTVEVIPKCNRSTKQIEKLQSKKTLTKQQQSLVKHLKTRVGRVAKYTCQICSYKTRIPLDARVKWPERAPIKTPTPESKAKELKEAYQKWLEETQKKRKRKGKSNAGLKIPPKPNNKTSNVKAPGNTPAGPMNTGKFKPTDFKLIQQLLESSVSSKTTTTAIQKPIGNKTVGRLRLSRS